MPVVMPFRSEGRVDLDGESERWGRVSGTRRAPGTLPQGIRQPDPGRLPGGENRIPAGPATRRDRSRSAVTLMPDRLPPANVEPTVLIRLSRDPDPAARRLASRLLGRMRGTDWAGAAAQSLLVPLGDADLAVRRAAMASLEQLGEGGLALVAREIWRGNPDIILVVSDRRLVGPLLTPLRLGPVAARCAAAAALASLGDRLATPALTLALQDPAFTVRAAAAHALGVLRDATAVPALLAALARPDRHDCEDWSDWHRCRVRILEALGRLRDPRARPPLEAALGDPVLAMAAADALGILGDPQAVDALAAAVGHPDPEVRAAAARGLGRLRAPRGAEALVSRLTDANGTVRRTAARALEALGDPRLGGLARAMQRGDPERVNSLGAEWALHLLLALLRHADPGARAGAARLLGERGDPRALSDLRRLSSWWAETDAGVRAACRGATRAILEATGAVGSEPVPAVPPEGWGSEAAPGP
jgi:HEAT repeat protein